MSKRNIALAVAGVALVLSTGSQAFAGRARQIVLGTGDPLGLVSDGAHGALYYDDNFNVFYNPAYANDFKNWVTIEKSNTIGATGAQEGEGGFVASMMGWSVGAYMNRVSTIPFTTAGTAAADITPLDIMFAGDTGVKWGILLNHGAAKNATGTARYLNLGVGAQIAELEPFAGFRVINTDKSVSPEQKAKAWWVGTRYKFGEWTPYVVVRSDNPAGKNMMRYGLGLGRNTKLGEGAMLNYAVGYWRDNDAKRNLVPIDVSIEADFLTWLTGRAGLTYRLLDRTNGNTTTGGDASARLGAGVHVGKLNWDFAVGGGTPTGGNGNVDATPFDFGSGLFAESGLTYTW